MANRTRVIKSLLHHNKLGLVNTAVTITRGLIFRRPATDSNIGSSQSSEIMAAAKQLVEAKIAGKKVMVFSKTYCPFCVKAKKALQAHIPEDLKEEDYEVLEIENRNDCQAIQDVLGKMTGARSVPRVFINGKFIGGGDEVSRAHSDGSLKKMLTA